jgi:hypothetical protein
MYIIPLRLCGIPGGWIFAEAELRRPMAGEKNICLISPTPLNATTNMRLLIEVGPNDRRW